ncbi:MAG: hypothetical protein OEW58_08200 [Gammaproteobacteria bacterium]|nr:hypothetical protein [Gammaproteobacteria bacterium]
MSVTQVLIKDGQLHHFEEGVDAKIVALVKAWIEFSVRDGEQTSANATQSIAQLQGILLNIQSAAARLQDQPANEKAQASLAKHMGEAQAMISSTVVALQFYDRVSQRLRHAKHFLDVGDVRATAELTSVLAMKDERVLFDAVLQGLSEDEAIGRALQALSDTVDDEGDIDLF